MLRASATISTTIFPAASCCVARRRHGQRCDAQLGHQARARPCTTFSPAAVISPACGVVRVFVRALPIYGDATGNARFPVISAHHRRPPASFPGRDRQLRAAAAGKPRLRAHQSADPRQAPAINPTIWRLIKTVIPSSPASAAMRPFFRRRRWRHTSPRRSSRASNAITTTTYLIYSPPRLHHRSSGRHLPHGPGRKAVVDERLRVRGFAGLRVVNASIMPAVVSGNTTPLRS